MAPHFPILLLATAALAGCAVVPGPVDYGPAYAPAYSTTVYAAVPAPRVEYRGLPPGPGQVWVDGYWNWGGSRYLWVPGRWSAQRPSQAWGPQFWQRESEPRRAHGGQWEEERRPPPQARPRFEEPERGWRNEPRGPRFEPPQAQIQPQPQPQPRRVPPPVIQQSEPGRAGFMRGLTERAQAERPEPAPRSADNGQRHPPEQGRRGGRVRPEEGDPSERH